MFDHLLELDQRDGELDGENGLLRPYDYPDDGDFHSDQNRDRLRVRRQAFAPCGRSRPGSKTRGLETPSIQRVV